MLSFQRVSTPKNAVGKLYGNFRKHECRKQSWNQCVRNSFHGNRGGNRAKQFPSFPPFRGETIWKPKHLSLNANNMLGCDDALQVWISMIEVAR
jgi:hypothetical protein